MTKRVMPLATRRQRGRISLMPSAPFCVSLLSMLCALSAERSVSAFVIQTPPQVAESKADFDARRSKERAEASTLLKSVMDAYRAAPSLDISTTVKVGAQGSQASADAKSSKAEFQFAPNREGVLSLNGYTLHLHEGNIRAFHVSNKDAFVEASDDGSPFYALFNAFGDLPFVELALALGEDSVEDVCMQLLSHTPDVAPSLVEEHKSADGSVESLHLFLEADGQRIIMVVDPSTKFVRSSTATVTQGAETEEGTTLSWSSTSIVVRSDDAMPASELWPDVGTRQKVDGLQSLLPQPRAPSESDGAEIGAPTAPVPPPVKAPQVGEEAPLFELPELTSGSLALKSVQGKFVLLDFWATWCGPCRAAMPAMTKMLAELDGRVVGLLINSGEQGDIEERKTRVREVLKTAGVPLEGAHAEHALLDLDGAAARAYGVRAFPTILLLSREGVILGQWEGWSKRAEEAIRALVVEGASPTKGTP